MVASTSPSIVLELGHAVLARSATPNPSIRRCIRFGHGILAHVGDDGSSFRNASLVPRFVPRPVGSGFRQVVAAALRPYLGSTRFTVLRCRHTPLVLSRDYRTIPVSPPMSVSAGGVSSSVPSSSRDSRTGSSHLYAIRLFKSLQRRLGDRVLVAPTQRSVVAESVRTHV